MRRSSDAESRVCRVSCRDGGEGTFSPSGPADTIDAARRNDEPRKLTASARCDAPIASANAPEEQNIARCCYSSPRCRRSTTIVSRREIGISARQRTHRRESLIAGISETATSCQPVDVNGQSCSVCALSIDRSLQRLMCTRNVCVLLPYVIHISDTMLVCAVAFRARDLLSRRVVLRMHFGSVRLFRC
jgi:hypothetical protein